MLPAVTALPPQRTASRAGDAVPRALRQVSTLPHRQPGGVCLLLLSPRRGHKVECPAGWGFYPAILHERERKCNRNFAILHRASAGGSPGPQRMPDRAGRAENRGWKMGGEKGKSLAFSRAACYNNSVFEPVSLRPLRYGIRAGGSGLLPPGSTPETARPSAFEKGTGIQNFRPKSAGLRVFLCCPSEEDGHFYFLRGNPK